MADQQHSDPNTMAANIQNSSHEQSTTGTDLATMQTVPPPVLRAQVLQTIQGLSRHLDLRFDEINNRLDSWYGKPPFYFY